jgi:hypothetical protein
LPWASTEQPCEIPVLKARGHRRERYPDELEKRLSSI